MFLQCLNLCLPFYNFLISYTNKMNNLKKALTRDDPKKYHKTKIQISGLKKHQQSHDIEWMFLKKTEKKPLQTTIQDIFRKIIESHVSNGELRDPLKLQKELGEKYKEVCWSEWSENGVDGVLATLNRMVKQQEGSIMKRYIEVALQKLDQLKRQQQAQEKAKCIDQFNKLFKKLRPQAFPKEELSSMNKALKHLVHSTSAANLRVKVTRDEYQLQEEQNPLKKKKSLDLKNKSKGSSHSHKNLSGGNKLQMFLKDTNKKLVKTKIEYDFSAIFEASKSNVQPRNKTTYQSPRNQKEVLTKAAKGKRDQAFVFYRPKKK